MSTPKFAGIQLCHGQKDWMDFEKTELNHEWIKENLKERKIQLQDVYMIPKNKIEHKSRT